MSLLRQCCIEHMGMKQNLKLKTLLRSFYKEIQKNDKLKQIVLHDFPERLNKKIQKKFLEEQSSGLICDKVKAVQYENK